MPAWILPSLLAAGPSPLAARFSARTRSSLAVGVFWRLARGVPTLAVEPNGTVPWE